MTRTIRQDAKTAACNTLRDALTAATRERGNRQHTVNTPAGPEMAWAVHERQVMWEAVNRIRADHSLPPVDAVVVEQIDSSAAGHADWFGKVVLRCAAVAVGEDWRR